MTTVVVVAGGDGTRFAAAYPKELHAIAPGVAVIDPLIDALDALPLPQVKVVLSLPARKAALAAHFERCRHDLAFVPDRHRGFQGIAAALASVAPWCDETVLICLGDQVYRRDPVLAFTIALERVQAGAPIVVIAAPTDDQDRLRGEGAVTITDGVVTAAAEKPSQPAGFNGCWSALAVDRDALPALARDLAAGTSDCLVDAPAVWGPDFLNLNAPADLLAANTAEGPQP